MRIESSAFRLAERIAQTQAEILARSLSALAADPKPGVFLGQVLSVMVEHCGAQGGSLWLDDPQPGKLNELYKHVYQVYALEGRTLIQRRAAQPSDRIMFSATKANVQQMQRGSVIRHGWRDIMENEVYLPHREFLVGAGTRHIAYVPMFFGRDYRGFITLRFGGRDVLKPDDEPFATALANQAVMALELSRATTEAREVEIGKQSQLAAEERIAELARVNAVLRDTVSGLQNLESFETFVRQTLSAAGEITGANTSALLLVRESSRKFVVQHVVRNSEWIDVEEDADYVSWREANSADPTNEADLFNSVFRKPGVWWVSVDDPLLPPRQREFHRRRGHASVAHVPLWLDGRPFGLMGLGFSQRERPAASKLELAGVLAHQLALAYEFRRLGAESRDTAVARERAAAEARDFEISRQNQLAAEERVAELVRVNAALSTALSGLQKLEDLETFAYESLGAAAELVGAFRSSLFLAEGNSRRMLPRYALEGGKRIDVDNNSEYVAYRALEAARTAEELDQRERVFLNPEDWWVSLDDPSVLLPLWAFHKSRGYASVARVPLWRNGCAIGFIGLVFTQAGRPPQAKLELVRVLAEQITLAFELRRLGAESRDAAVARERAAAEARDLEVSRQNQLAAEERAAELARVNTALSGAISGLQDLEDLETFVYQTLDAASEIVGAVDPALFMVDDEKRRMVIRYMWGRGERIDIAGDPAFALFRVSERAETDEDLARWNRVFLKPENWWVRVDDPSVPAPSQDFHRGRGHVSAARVPLWRDGRPFGFIGLGFTHEGCPAQEKLELVRVLAEQIALAFELRRLGAESRDAAVARERAAAEARDLEISRQNQLAAEKRVAELVRVNAALSSALSGLQHFEGLGTFLCRTLTAAASIFGAAGATLFLADRDRRGMVATYGVKNGEPVDVATDPDYAPWHGPDKADTPEDLDFWEWAFKDPRYSWTAVDDPSMPSLAQELATRRGQVSVAIVPLWQGDSPLGFIGLGFLKAGRPAQTQLELVRVVAQQVALAYEFTRLGVEGRDVAVALEREHALVSRLAQLETANAALARSTAKLSTQNDIHAYLGSLLQTFLQHLHAGSGLLWLLQPDGSRRLAVRATEAAVRSFAVGEPCTDETVRAKEALLAIIEGQGLQPRRSSWMAEDIATTPVLDEHGHIRAKLVSAGVRALLDMPVVAGDQQFGSIMVCLATPRRWTAEQIELAQAQANQAALAMEMGRLGELARQSAITEERNRFAREIHDTLAQDFLAIAAHLQSARRKLAASDLPPAKAGPIAAALNVALGTAQDGLVEARRSVWALVPRGLEKGVGLATALRAAVDRIAPDRAAVSETGVPCALPVEVEVELLGIVREALSNASRHAGKHASIDVCIRYEKDALHVSVEDDGAGCDLAATENPRAGHFGLWTMRERAARIGGRLELLSAAGEGTCVAICVPWRT